jgi:HAD superfamily hydrolase (TIGR01450 family)
LLGQFRGSSQGLDLTGPLPAGAGPLDLGELRSVRHWFLDIDGTVYLSGNPLPGALEFVAALKSAGIGHTFLTNNSSRASTEYALKLSRLGFPADPRNVFTSGQAAAAFLTREHPGAAVYLLGTPSLAAELSAAGVSVAEDQPDMVVLGFDPQLSFERLTRACTLVRSGVPYVATHPDVNCPVAGGYLPDAGAVMALIEASTGRRPDQIVGKPNRTFIAEAASLLGIDLRECAMVGDRLETDVAMALDVGIPGVLVLTGATGADDQRLRQSPWRERVHVLAGLGALHRGLGLPSN